MASLSVAWKVVAPALVLQLPGLGAVLAHRWPARVAAGPRLSSLGQLATRWVTPRITPTPKQVPGPPKRWAQGIERS